jgi:sulfonate transport system permease protein
MTAAARPRLAPPRGALPALGALALLLGWEAFARATAGGFVIAGPAEVVRHLAAEPGLYARATLVTLRAAAWGFLWGNLAGIALALLAALAPRAERMATTLGLLVFCLPLVATGPVLRVLLGPGTGPQVALAALAVFFTTYVPLLVGLRAAPQSWFDLVRSYGRGRVAALWRVRLPASLPYLVAGLQIAAPAAILGAMVGEFTGAERGLGVLTIQAIRGLDVPATWTVAALATAAAMAAYAAFGALGRGLGAAPPALLLASPAGGPGRSPLRRLLGAAATLALALLLWQGLMDAAGLSPFFAKRPGDAWAHLVTGPGAAENRAVLGAALGETLAFAGPGYLAGLALGAGLAALLVLLPGLAAIALPLAVALRSVPIVATAPLIVLALGRGAAGTVAVVAAMVFFPTLVACLSGLARAPRAVLDVFDSYRAGRVRRLLHAQVPAMLPALFGAARMAIPAAILAVTTAEWLATGRGLGALMATVAMTSDYAALWSAIALIGAAALLAHAGVAALERAALARWAPEQLAP